ncbi:MAG: EamA family transporter, partial [Victivallaceae bacterium]
LLPGVDDWLYLSCFAFFCTIGLYYFQIKSLEKISAFTLSLSYNLEPVYSILLAMWIFKEHKTFTFPFYVSLALIVIAVAGQSCLMILQRQKNK